MKKITITLLGLVIGTASFAQRTLIYCGTLIDGATDTPRTQVTVSVEKNKIVGIESGYTRQNSGDVVIDLKNKTVLPGLMDMHVHLSQEIRRGRDVDRFLLNPADVALQAAYYAKITLMAGFTTVRDAGGENVIALRNAVNRGILPGPRIYAAGRAIATTGGHADPTNSYRRDLMGDPGPMDGVINGADEARKAVRQRYKEGSDVIKITATGGVLSLAKDGKGPQFTDEEARAICETARDYGLQVMAHAHGAEGMKRAIRAGVSSIEHGTYMDDEAIELFKQKGTYLVPTIIAGKSTADSAQIMGYFSAIVRPKALTTGLVIQATFGKAYKAGVKIAFGTDAGVFAHGKNAKEFEYMTEAGMPAMKAIQSATASAAQLLGVLNEVGTIEKGKMADIIAVDENPLQNIKSLQNVTFVMKDGIVYK